MASAFTRLFALALTALTTAAEAAAVAVAVVVAVTVTVQGRLQWRLSRGRCLGAPGGLGRGSRRRLPPTPSKVAPSDPFDPSGQPGQEAAARGPPRPS